MDIQNVFDLSFLHINKCLQNEDLQIEIKKMYGGANNLSFIKKGIYHIIYDKNEWLNDCYRIEISIEYNSNEVGYYNLFIDKDQNFIDEFLVID
ncbi:hypothetical protein [Chryseobacterium sp. ISL-6]|uniref:hypothetical protein n=1 Tax=Chryseobacterium sp. ISL-6 TaxID=2819143 RepID=UPI001BE899E2|nr:hypothetical protein [Chryseobacterium sp. ISL-6]MBT2620284.1 hypothetical protein [Chryseobacterium sp. ISL-6]